MALAYSGTMAAITAAAALLPEGPAQDNVLLEHLARELEHLQGPVWHDFEREFFLSTFARYFNMLRRIRNAPGGYALINGERVERALAENYLELPKAPTRFLEVKTLVDSLIVLKVVRSDLSILKDYVSDQIAPLANQIEALNKNYGVRIPLVLCATVATRERIIKDVANRLSTCNVEIRVLTQCVFPVVDMRNDMMNIDTEAQNIEEISYEPGDGYVLSRISGNPLFATLSKRKKILMFLGAETCCPIIDTRDGYVLSRISGNPLFATLSKRKKILMFLGAETCCPIIDTRILSFVANFEVEFCLESMLGKHLPANIKDMDSMMTFRVGGNLKVFDRGQAQALLHPEALPLHYWSNNIMWVKLDSLNHLFNYNMLNLVVFGRHTVANTVTRTQITTRAASAAEIFKNSTVVHVPQRRRVLRTSDLPHLHFLYYLMNPTFTHHLRPRILMSVVLFYIMYHAVLVFVGVFLHHKVGGSREKRIWLENVIWVIILLIYIFILYKWRSRRFEYPLDPDSRKRELRADFFQLALHGVSRCIYLGLTATAEEHEWYKDRRWVVLCIIHSSVAVIEILCSYLIELIIGSGFKEPAEI